MNPVRMSSLSLLAALVLFAQNLAEFEKKVTEFTLANGLHFIVVERHEAPVVSFNTYVNAGSLNDPLGQTGIAHMFEHMAFKGTPAIGSKSWEEEKTALEKVEEAYEKLEAEKRKGLKADSGKIEMLRLQVKYAIDWANQFVETNAYPQIIEENGGVGMNAGTGLESTNYYYNFPANRLELWFLLESQRFLRPVYREFYKERDVVANERRDRIESNPQGKLMEMFLSTAFAAHPYRQMPGGWGSDIDNLRVPDAERFFRTYYVPANITIGIAGDVRTSEVRRLAEKYFSALPNGTLPPLVHTVEPAQAGPKRVEVESPSQPLVFIGYKRPDQYHADDPVFDVIQAILTSGRTAMLYKEMVRDKKVALALQSSATFPGGKYPNLFVFLLVPSAGRTVDENEKLLYEVLERLKSEPVEKTVLERVKTQSRAGLIRRLDNNSGLASMLTTYHVAYGSWKKLFSSLDDLARVSAEDVQRVAREYFVDKTRTVALTVQPPAAGRTRSAPKPAAPAGRDGGSE